MNESPVQCVRSQVVSRDSRRVRREPEVEAIMRSVFKFFLITYVASWIPWIAAAAILGWDFSQPSPLVAISTPLYLLGVFAPALVALALTAQAEGRAGILALLRRTV